MAFNKLPTLTQQSQMFLTHEAVAHRDLTPTDSAVLRSTGTRLKQMAYGRNGEPTTEPYYLTGEEKGERIQHGLSRAWILSEFRNGNLDDDTRRRLQKNLSGITA